MQPSLNGIRRLSNVLSWGCIFFVAVFPLLGIAYWLTAAPPELAAGAGLSPASVLTVAPWQRALGAAVTLIPLLMLSVGLFHARACFQEFARGAFFTMKTVSRLRRFAGWVCASVFFGFIARASLSVLLTIPNPPGQRSLSLGVSSDQLFTLFIAGMVWLIAAVMTRAAAFADDGTGKLTAHP